MIKTLALVFNCDILNKYSDVVQLVEQRTVNPCVAGSSQAIGDRFFVIGKIYFMNYKYKNCYCSYVMCWFKLILNNNFMHRWWNWQTHQI